MTTPTDWPTWEPRLRAARANNGGRLPTEIASASATALGVSTRTIHRWLGAPPQGRPPRRYELSDADRAAIAATSNLRAAWSMRYPDGSVSYVTFWRACRRDRSCRQARRAA